MHQRVFSICSKNVHSHWSYECPPNTINVFDSGRTWSGQSKMSLIMTMPHCMGSVRGSADKSSGLYNRNYFMAWKHRLFWNPAATEQNLQNYLVLEGYSQAVWLEILHGRNHRVSCPNMLTALHVYKTHPLCEESQYYCSQTYLMDTGHTTANHWREQSVKPYFLKWGVWLRWQLSKAVTEFLQGMLWGLVHSHRMTYCFWLKLFPNFINTALFKPSLITCNPSKACRLTEQLNYSNFCLCQLNSGNFIMKWNSPDHHQMMECLHSSPKFIQSHHPPSYCRQSFKRSKHQHYNFPSSFKISKPDNTRTHVLLIY